LSRKVHASMLSLRANLWESWIASFSWGCNVCGDARFRLYAFDTKCVTLRKATGRFLSQWSGLLRASYRYVYSSYTYVALCMRMLLRPVAMGVMKMIEWIASSKSSKGLAHRATHKPHIYCLVSVARSRENGTKARGTRTEPRELLPILGPGKQSYYCRQLILLPSIGLIATCAIKMWRSKPIILHVWRILERNCTMTDLPNKVEQSGSGRHPTMRWTLRSQSSCQCHPSPRWYVSLKLSVEHGFI
jgi:hypothetical protein